MRCELTTIRPSGGRVPRRPARRSPIASRPRCGARPLRRRGRRRGEDVRRGHGDLPHAPLGRARPSGVPAERRLLPDVRVAEPRHRLPRRRRSTAPASTAFTGDRGTAPDVTSCRSVARSPAGCRRSRRSTSTTSRSTTTARSTCVLSRRAPAGHAGDWWRLEPGDAHPDVAQRLVGPWGEHRTARRDRPSRRRRRAAGARSPDEVDATARRVRRHRGRAWSSRGSTASTSSAPTAS